MGHKKTGEGERCALLGIAGAPVEPLGLQLRGHQRRDRQRHAAVLIQAVDQHIGGRPFPRVVADENRDRRGNGRHGPVAGGEVRPQGQTCAEQTIAVDEPSVETGHRGSRGAIRSEMQRMRPSRRRRSGWLRSGPGSNRMRLPETMWLLDFNPRLQHRGSNAESRSNQRHSRR